MTTPIRKSPGLAFASLRVFDLSLGEMLWSRRTIFMALVVGLPMLLSGVIRLLFEMGAPMTRMTRGDATGPVVFGLMMWGFFVRFSVPVLAVFYGTSLVADEVDDKTITYLFTRPIPREAVLVGKYLAYLACTIFVVVPATIVVWLLIAPIRGDLASTFPDLLKDLGIIAIGLAVYGSVFALVGAVLKRPLLFGLIFIFGWESLAMALPGSLKRFTVAYYLQGLVPQAMPGDGPMSLIQAIFRDVPTVSESLIWMSVIALVSLTAAARAVATREYVLEQ